MTDRPLVMVGIVGALAMLGVVLAVFLSAQMERSQRFDDAPRQVIPQERVVKKAAKKFFDISILPALVAGGGWELYIQYDYDDAESGILIADKDSIQADSPIGAKGSRIFWIGVDGYVHSYDVVNHTYDSALLEPNAYGGTSAVFDSFNWEVSVEDGAFVFTNALSGMEEEDEAVTTPVGSGQGSTSSGDSQSSDTSQPVIPATNPDENLIVVLPVISEEVTPYSYAQANYAPTPSLFGGSFSATLLTSDTCPAIGFPVKVQDDPVVGILISPMEELPTGAQLSLGARPGGIDVQFENDGHNASYGGGSFDLRATRHAGAAVGTFTIPLTVRTNNELLWDCDVVIVNE